MDADAPLVYVVTVNWNNAPDTLACLETLSRLSYPNYRLLEVENGSTDDSPERIAEAFPQVEQVRIPENTGFAGGFNAGIRHALEKGAEYVFIVNNDTLADAGMLEPLVEAAAPPDVGAVAPLIFYATEPERIWSAGAGRSRWTLELTGNHGREMSIPAARKPVEREFLSGCALLLKRNVLENLGLLDEGFFLYYEDSDYSLRLRQAGYRLLLVPQARLWHKVSRSSLGSDSPGERYWMARSSVRFFRKHVRGWRWLVVIPWRLGSASKTTLRLVSHGNFRAARYYWRGLWEGLWNEHP
ncbi:MAG: glycosyltransferase family 2 protein [Anaerolineae bacterium]|nr:MAG: glycosyltransferase family 2 protein [Anaerolineae bacterium]